MTNRYALARANREYEAAEARMKRCPLGEKARALKAVRAAALAGLKLAARRNVTAALDAAGQVRGRA